MASRITKQVCVSLRHETVAWLKVTSTAELRNFSNQIETLIAEARAAREKS